MPESFHCSLVTPETELFEGQVEYASIPARDGQIGLMCQRAPLLVKLGDGALRLDLPDKSTRAFFVGGGFAQMKDNKLSVIANQATDASELSREHAQALLDEALKRVPAGEEALAKRQQDADRARAMLTIASK